jgi:hypothetical protein
VSGNEATCSTAIAASTAIAMPLEMHTTDQAATTFGGDQRGHRDGLRL